MNLGFLEVDGQSSDVSRSVDRLTVELLRIGSVTSK